MPERLQLDDGGPLHHPHSPMGFHPGLRAAAHLLVACESVRPGTRRSFHDQVLLPHTVRRPVDDLRSWATDHHLASPYVIEVLYMTLSAWHTARRKLALARHDLDALPDLEPALKARLLATETLCTQALEGWGPWVAILRSTPEDAVLDPLFELAAPLPFLGDPHHLPAPMEVELGTWLPEIETWDDCERRLREEFERTLRRHRERVESEFLTRGYRPAPVKTAEHHFEWLALRQLKGARPVEISRRFSVGASTIHEALSHLSKLLELPLRPVRPGPETW